jgi:thioredoxin-like negative regulator of GroEL
MTRFLDSLVITSLVLSLLLLSKVATGDDAVASNDGRPSASSSITLESIPSASKRSLKEAGEATSVSLSQASHLVALHDDNYDTFVRNTDRLTVLLFYTLWSRKSLQFISDFSDAADDFIGQDDIAFGIVNCANHKKLCKHARVTHFPHMRIVVRGNVDYFHAYSSYHESTREIIDFIGHIKLTDRRRAAREKKHAEEEAAKPVPMFHPTPGVPFEMDPETFVNYTSSTQLLVMVMFYAPWCESCKSMHDILLDVADYFTLDRKVSIGKIDCDRYLTFCIEKGIQGYPTLMTYAKPIIAKGGSIYDGERNSADIKNYLDLQNFYTHSDQLTEIKAQFDKFSKMSESERPLDPSEMGGIFGTFAGMKPSDKPEKIGNDPRKPLEEEWKW